MMTALQPARMRKKNRLYFDDDLVSSPTQVKSPKKAARGTPKKQANPQPLPVVPVKLVSEGNIVMQSKVHN